MLIVLPLSLTAVLVNRDGHEVRRRGMCLSPALDYNIRDKR